MAYNPYFPVTYPQMQYAQPTPQIPSVAQPQTQSGLIWVQGEAGAKSYLVAPNTTVMLMDSESEKFFIKSSDASGMPQPLRIFEYHEIAQNAPKNDFSLNPNNYTDYVTKREFEALQARVDGILNDTHNQSENTLTKDGGKNG